MNNEAYVKQVKLFGKISLAEGVSFLLLIFIAMPVKYVLGIPEFVKYLGWAHGLLFMIYVFQLLYITYEFKWKFKRLVIFFIAAFLPIAPFLVERKLRKEIESN